jgi:hypothetical protein
MTTPNQLMLFRGIVAVRCENHADHIDNTVWAECMHSLALVEGQSKIYGRGTVLKYGDATWRCCIGASRCTDFSRQTIMHNNCRHVNAFPVSERPGFFCMAMNCRDTRSSSVGIRLQIGNMSSNVMSRLKLTRKVGCFRRRAVSGPSAADRIDVGGSAETRPLHTTWRSI